MSCLKNLLWNALSLSGLNEEQNKCSFLANRQQNHLWFFKAWEENPYDLTNPASVQSSWLDDESIRRMVYHSNINPGRISRMASNSPYNCWTREVSDTLLENDPIFLEMKTSWNGMYEEKSNIKIENRVIFPLELYLNDVPFRLMFFQK